ncbi:hypothetical protein AB0I81_48090 [Nonomuraea sp. NPDC050404]|uniref:hypothetical protein n=1 Tax=Nonomuraea sp. NPDC050404 TaxID=3155783 RepID=UPI0033F52FB8
MNALIRAALVGAVVGLTEAALAAHLSVFTLLMMLLVPVPLSLALSYWGRLPRWWLVALLGPVGAIACFGMLPVTPAELAGMTGWVGYPAFMGLCALGFALATFWVVPAGRAARLTAVGAFAVFSVTALLGRDSITVLVAAQTAVRDGLPLVAAKLPDYRLTDVTVDDGRHLILSYERSRDGQELMLQVERRSEKTPRSACADVAESGANDCREVADGVWRDESDPGMLLFAVRGDAFIEAYNEVATQEDVLAVLRAVRPVQWWELAWS